MRVTGNAGKTAIAASAAAYGAAAGMDVIVVLPKGQIATGKLRLNLRSIVVSLALRPFTRAYLGRVHESRISRE